MASFVLFLTLIGSLRADQPNPRPAAIESFLTKNCVACHQGASASMGIDLRTLAFGLDDAHLNSLWVRVHDAVESKRMPPPSARALTAVERAAFVKAVAQPLLAHELTATAKRGRSVLRRLNRYEYENTLRDLLSAPWLHLRDSLPEDGILARFNKSGQALDVSHVQMGRYLDTAEHAIRAVLDATGAPARSSRHYAREQKRFISRMKFGPFNSAPERATIPILGFDSQPDVIAEKAPMTVGDADPKTRDLEGFATTASTYIGNEYHFDGFTAPVGGRYRIKLNAFSIWAETVLVPAPGDRKKKAWRPSRNKTWKGRTVEPVTLYALSRGGEKRLLGTFDVTPEPQLHELEVHLLPGEQILPDASRLFRSRPGWISSPDWSEAGTPGVGYRWMDVEGPLETPAARDTYRRLFGSLKATRNDAGRVVRVDGAATDAEMLLREFMRSAYRRPPTEDEFVRYLRILRSQLASRGDGNLLGPMIAAYTAVLCSPGFLYLEETPGRLNGHSLASRLSYFLWNTAPDSELRSAAASGALLKPEVLRTQTRRLLASPRANDFLNAFLDYWLDLRRIGDNTPDQTLYPEAYLDDLLVESSLAETQLFFAELLRRDLPAANLVDSKFTFLNSHLARHYGLPPVEGVSMRIVNLPAGSVRGGLLTQASVLRITANGTTTSPVLRGVWIMERILGDPPPPPPAGVPAIEPDTRGATTIRQQLDKHRSVPSCAGCHNKIDPPGFALESFDVVGAWRDRYRSLEEGEPVHGFGKNGWAFTFRKAQAVDASGRLANGTEFQDVVGLKRALLKDERQIARNLVRQFLAYATGTPAGFADRAEVERILASAQPSRYGLRTLLEKVVESSLFTRK
ncbi:MAG: DUF1592 domain-containing protein [Acidobacteria bacterium]|nr:DUF1592 domain-containing protein [Acidobacteriota bacterium]